MPVAPAASCPEVLLFLPFFNWNLAIIIRVMQSGREDSGLPFDAFGNCVGLLL